MPFNTSHTDIKIKEINTFQRIDNIVNIQKITIIRVYKIKIYAIKMHIYFVVNDHSAPLAEFMYSLYEEKKTNFCLFIPNGIELFASY